MNGPTEVAGSRAWRLGGYHLVFYPDLSNAFRTASQPSVFHWMPDRLHLARTTDRYDFGFTRYHRRATEQDGVCGMVRFALATQIPTAVLNEATEQFLRSCSRSDPYWGWSSHDPANFVPLTYQYTHTTLSNIAARSEPVARLLAGADPWYCEKQGDRASPLKATEVRAYTTLLGSYYTQMFQRAVVDGTQSLMVNRTVGIEFGAPITKLIMGGSRTAMAEALLSEAAACGRDGDRDITLDGVWRAVRRLRADGALSVECELDDALPDDGYRENLLERSGFLDGVFLDLARETVLTAPEPSPTALSADVDGPPNPWGASWRVAGQDASGTRGAEQKRVLIGVTRYIRPISVPTDFADEFTVIRREPARYFVNRYPADENRQVTRVFRPVLAQDNPAVSSLAVSCGYPDASGEYVYEARVFPKADQPGEQPQPWYYSTARRSMDEVPHPLPGWTPDRTFVRRRVVFASGGGFTSDLVTVQNDDQEMDIDPGPHGSLFNDIAIDVSPRMLRHLDIYPIVLQPGLRTGEELTVRLEALDAEGAPHQRYRAAFSWRDKEDHRPRRWMVYSRDPAFVARYRYQVSHAADDGTVVTRPWITACGNWSLHISVPRGTEDVRAAQSTERK